MLAQRLRRKRLQVETLAFPTYSTAIGQLIKASLETYTTPQVKHMLLAANRWEMHPTLNKWLGENKVVVLDRFSASNYVYGAANGLPLTWLRSLEKGLPVPDMTVLVDITPETSLKRKMQGRDVHERDLKFLSKVRGQYLKLARSLKWTVVNGMRIPSEVHEDIALSVETRLNRMIENS